MRETPLDLGKASSVPGWRFAGRYEVLALLGEGGMGAVYRVRDVELDEQVALKVLHPAIEETAGALERFRREVKLARRVTHPHVARVFDFGASDGRRFLTMELVEGQSLAKRLEEARQLPLSDALRITVDIARGLAAAHAAGVVHRDLKPDNVMIDAGAVALHGSERVVVTDFGIAVLAKSAAGNCRTDSIIGTPEYMAPEQVEGFELDGRADVYALGVMLFEMLAGRLPFEGPTAYIVAALRLTHPAPSLSAIVAGLPEPVAVLVEQMLEREREARPDMLRVVDAIDALRGGGKWGQGSLGRRRSTAQPLSARSAVTIAVAPFATSDEASRELAAAVVEAVADALAGMRGLRVIPSATVRSAVASSATAGVHAALGAHIAASLVIEGSVRVVGDRARIRARVVQVGTGVQVWGAKFDEATAGALALEDEVARAIHEAVTAEVLSGAAVTVTEEAAGVVDDGPADPAARAVYEKGVEAAREFGDHIERAIEYLSEANRLAPNDPHIMSALGAALVRQWSFGGSSAVLSEAEDWSLRALATGTRIGQTFNTIGVLRLHQGELRAAVDAFREASARSPRLAEPSSYVGRLLSESGHVEEAARALRRAVELDPTDHHALSELARLAAMDGDWVRTNTILDQAATGRAEGIVRATKARFMVWRRDPASLAAAVADVEARSADPGLRVVVRLLLPVWKALANGEVIAEGDARLGALEDAAAGTSMRLTMFWYQLLAEVHAVCGHEDAALEAIEAASMRTLIDVLWIDRCPALRDLRGNARLSRARATVAARAAALWR